MVDKNLKYYRLLNHLSQEALAQHDSQGRFLRFTPLTDNIEACIIRMGDVTCRELPEKSVKAESIMLCSGESIANRFLKTGRIMKNSCRFLRT